MWSLLELQDIPETLPESYFLLITNKDCNVCETAKNQLIRTESCAPLFVDNIKNHKGIRGTPTIRFIKDGKNIAELSGFTPLRLSNFIYLNSLKYDETPKITRICLMFLNFIISSYRFYKIYNILFTPKSIKKYRRDICKSCPKRMGPICGDCLCVIKSKTAMVSSSCPLGKW